MKFNIPPLRGGEPEFVDIVKSSFVVLPIVPDLDPSIFDFLSKYDKVIFRYWKKEFPLSALPERAVFLYFQKNEIICLDDERSK